jgi:hypothetical protein
MYTKREAVSKLFGSKTCSMIFNMEEEEALFLSLDGVGRIIQGDYIEGSRAFLGQLGFLLDSKGWYIAEINIGDFTPDNMPWVDTS